MSAENVSSIPARPKAPEPPTVMAPASDIVELPIGYPTPHGVITTVRVRELNGFDEEAVARAKGFGALLMTVLDRAVVAVGDEKVDSTTMKEMFLADRLAVLVGIAKCTWGNITVITVTCPDCGEVNQIDYDLEELEVTTANPEDAYYEVTLRKGGVAKVHWAKGDVHEALLLMTDVSSAQFRTVLINKCVDSINGMPVFGDAAKRLSVPDRTTLVDAVNEVYLGPRFDKSAVSCPDCGKEISPALTPASMFSF